ncbi:MAG: OmpA family protein [Candidatus Eisenbacteria bacterium]
MRRSTLVPLLAVLAPLLLLGTIRVTPALGIGLGDLKKKAEDKVKEKVGQKVPDAAPAESTANKAEGAGKATEAKGGETSITKISSKYDYVPGDKVLLEDDFSTDPVGEFPVRLRLLTGNFEVAESSGKHWFRLVGDDGQFELKEITSLPERWTFEFDLRADKQARFEVHGPRADGRQQWWVDFGSHGNDLLVMANGRQSYTTLSSGDFSGAHHIAFMAMGKSLKIYVDQDRVANIPELEGDMVPGPLTFRMRWPDANALITNLRFAEKSEPKPDLLADGPFVTHGIYFDSGSDHVRPESAPVFRQLAAYLTANAAVRVKITGHTDDVGSDAANLDLSSRRAAAVAAVLAADFGMDASRFETEGKGETAPIAKNDSPEGRAMNRRVEFEKIK